MIRCQVLRCLIWVCTVCLCPKNGLKFWHQKISSNFSTTWIMLFYPSGKDCRPWSHCSFRNSLIWAYNVCQCTPCSFRSSLTWAYTVCQGTTWSFRSSLIAQTCPSENLGSLWLIQYLKVKLKWLIYFFSIYWQSFPRQQESHDCYIYAHKTEL